MANEFNSFFSRVGRNIADSVEPSKAKPSNYLPKITPPPHQSRLWTLSVLWNQNLVLIQAELI